MSTADPSLQSPPAAEVALTKAPKPLDPPEPARFTIERQLRRHGLRCAINDHSRLVEMRRAFASGLPLGAWLVVCAVYLLLWTVWTSVDADGPSRFWTYLLFDVLTATMIVLATLVVLAKAAWGRERITPDLVLGCLLFLVLPPLLFPYVVFGALQLDTTVRDGLAAPIQEVFDAGSVPTPRDSQSLLLHMAITAALAFALCAELRWSILRQGVALLGSALKATPDTVLDVLRTLPVLLAALFFLSFVEELWRVVGGLDLPRLVTLIALMFASVVAFIRSAASEEANKALVDEVYDPKKPEYADIAKDKAIKTLQGPGVSPSKLCKGPGLERAIRLQCTIHIAMRTVFAGVVLAALALLVMSLTLTETIASEWMALPKEQKPDGSQIVSVPLVGLDLYYTTDAVAVAAVVGAFASVVFAGSALNQDDVRKRLLRPEHGRLRHLLFLAGTYKTALEQERWVGKPGMRYESVRRFEADDARRRPYPEKLGNQWSDGGTRWAARWQSESGELFIRQIGRGLSALVRGTEDARVTEILAVCKDRDQVLAALAGWDHHQYADQSLDWLRERAATLQSGISDQSEAPGGSPTS